MAADQQSLRTCTRACLWRELSGSRVHIEFASRADTEKAWQHATAFPDQTFSLVDLISFAMMERMQVLRAASLDHHFSIFRFGVRRERAFDIVC